MRKVILAVGTITVLPVLSVLAVLGGGELGFRLYQRWDAGIPFRASLGQEEWNPAWSLVLDDKLGWKARAGYRDEATETTAKGVRHRVMRSQKDYGFRMFGDPHSAKPRLLVIGDSFTQASQVSDDETYYASFNEALGVEVFAYGAGGYGTLQEYMILDQYIDMIKPDMILWEFCANDFINNDPALEAASSINNNGWRRPYWVDGQVVYILPKSRSASFRIFAQKHSRFLHFLLFRWDRLLAMHPVQTVEDEIDREGFSHKGFQHALQVTSELMGKVRSRAGEIPIVTFSCEPGPLYDRAFETITSRHHMVFLKDIAQSVEDARQHGEDVLDADLGHWSVEGHRLAGSLIREHLRGILPVSAQLPGSDASGVVSPRRVSGLSPSAAVR